MADYSDHHTDLEENAGSLNSTLNVLAVVFLIGLMSHLRTSKGSLIGATRYPAASFCKSRKRRGSHRADD